MCGKCTLISKYLNNNYDYLKIKNCILLILLKVNIMILFIGNILNFKEIIVFFYKLNLNFLLNEAYLSFN